MARATPGEYTPPNKAVADLIDKISPALRKWIDEGTPKHLIRAAAPDIIQLRSLFERNGAPDWEGRSGGYQHAMGEIYSRLNLQDDRKKIQSLLSHHVNVVLRERVKGEELKAVGMDERSPNIRLAQKRDINAATASAVGIMAGARESLPALMSLVVTMIEHASTLAAEPLTKQERAAVKALLPKARKGLDALSKDL